jgi:tetratricopeptide (TPR) repeat protein
MIFIPAYDMKKRNTPVKKQVLNEQVYDSEIQTNYRQENFANEDEQNQETDYSYSENSYEKEQNDTYTYAKQENRKTVKYTEIEDLEPITGDNVSEFESKENVDIIADKFFSANKYKSNKDYVKAIDEFSSVAEKTSDRAIKSKCYEEIAYIYAIDKKYGTALSYCQKAYNAYPSSSIELLMARIYYKTGQAEKAKELTERVLNRDFSRG